MSFFVAPPRPLHLGVSDDLDLLLQALEPSPGKRFLVLSAHGAGESALALVGAGAEQVVAADLDPFLHQILELKLNSARLLGREDYLAIMGLRPASPLRQNALTDQVLRGLEPAARAYWRPRRAWLKEGLFRADRLARLLQLFFRGVDMAAPKDAPLIRGAGTPEARKEAFRRVLRDGWLERALRALGHYNLFFPAAEWTHAQYPREFNRDPLGYLEPLVQAGLADNPLFGYLVRNPEQPLPLPLLPPHLRPGVFDALRTAAVKIRCIPAPLGHLEDLPLHGAYLSNVVDYLSASDRATLFDTILPALLPGSPILWYSNDWISKGPASTLVADPRAAELASKDRARIYRRLELQRTPGQTPNPAPRPKLRVVE